MSRPLHLPHSFGLVFIRTSVGWRLGYGLGSKRSLPLFVQAGLIFVFNRVACGLLGHEYLPIGLRKETDYCLHCTTVKPCPDCNGTGRNYFIPAEKRAIKPSSVPLTLFNCKKCGGKGNM
jgi:hypothetical protein